jgi:hypothetical protein
MKLFEVLVIETAANCNRRCKTCLRESYPDRRRLAERYTDAQMPGETVYRLIDEAADMGFRGFLGLSHFNEPLMDPRIAEFGRYAKDKAVFKEVFLDTNGDYLNTETASKLDGVFDCMDVALYGSNREDDEKHIASLFSKTGLIFTKGQHIVSHFSPFRNLHEAMSAHVADPCIRECQVRMIVAYTGEMLLCCCDLVGFWELGSVHTSNLHDLWFSDRHRKIIEKLSQPTGRWTYPMCRICPRPPGKRAYKYEWR